MPKKKIELSELIAKIQNKKITTEELEKYFVIDEGQSKAFAPTFVLNHLTVDTTGADRTARLAAPMLAAEASRAIKTARSDAKHSKKATARIVAEGDSWFNLPDIIYPDTIVDILDDDYPIVNLAMYGDELEEMILHADYMPYLSNGGVEYLMFSGGGNDAIGGGSIATCLNLYDPDHTDPKQAAYYINAEFDKVLNRVDTLYRRLASQVCGASPDTKIVVHGYDYAIPKHEGPFLGQPMQMRGLDPAWDADLCNAIIALMVDRLNTRLRGLPQDNVIYVDLRGTAGGVKGWFDELHPSTATAKKMAKRFAAVLGAAGGAKIAKKKGKSAEA